LGKTEAQRAFHRSIALERSEHVDATFGPHARVTREHAGDVQKTYSRALSSTLAGAPCKLHVRF
jgi:hypothetical protein